MGKRIYFIDIARAISIILIVMYHYQPDNSPDYWIAFNSVIKSFRLPLLLFVSGYIYWVTRKPVAYKDFVWKKFQRLMIPYFFVSILIITIKLIVEGGLQVDNPVSPSAYYQMFYLPSVSGFFLWFIYTLFLVFLIMPFFDTRRKLLYLLGISLALYFIPVSFPELFALSNMKNSMVYFVSGCVLCEYAEIREKISRVNVFVCLGVFATGYALRALFDFGMAAPALTFALALCGIYVVVNFARTLDRKTNKIRVFLLGIASCTYTIYLFHTTFMGFAKAVILKIVNTIPSNTIVFICTALTVILAGIIIPVILHKIVVNHSKIFSFLIGAKFTGKEINKV
jgi:fucose 4-O-acetylase-like acetyltransferase